MALVLAWQVLYWLDGSLPPSLLLSHVWFSCCSKTDLINNSMLKVWEGRKDSRVSLWVLLDIYQKDRRPGKQINSVSCADVRHLDYNTE